MGSKECLKGVRAVHRSYFYAVTILTSNSLYTGGQNSCGATVEACIVCCDDLPPEEPQTAARSAYGAAQHIPPKSTAPAALLNIYGKNAKTTSLVNYFDH